MRLSSASFAMLGGGDFLTRERWCRVLVRQVVVSGILYGAVVYGVMNLIVVSLSAFPRKMTYAPPGVATDLASHLFFIGLPIALASGNCSDFGCSLVSEQIPYLEVAIIRAA